MNLFNDHHPELKYILHRQPHSFKLLVSHQSYWCICFHSCIQVLCWGVENVLALQVRERHLKDNAFEARGIVLTFEVGSKVGR
ncbi:bf3ec723-f04a-4f79-934f-b77e5d0e4e41 [Sclerotinia trifoliorum]|uniref:Bf3ec723-f04a-4f79-934f-b77e5d0e4e41 n=1 Tax=Sclerotinia trifoliorum TaxID=28548 RepID=A0A8H2ZTZ1_9HELO|nr:bf3ec723-f04a-4f79-934f-b77e5d0e4e41 [Sclerotinia trifoliorum]